MRTPAREASLRRICRRGRYSETLFSVSGNHCASLCRILTSIIHNIDHTFSEPIRSLSGNVCRSWALVRRRNAARHLFLNTNMRQANARRKRLCVFTVLIKEIPLRAENFAAFRASTLDDITAVCRLHALTESVNLAPLTLLGLECTYHPNTPRFISRILQASPVKGLIVRHVPEKNRTYGHLPA